MAEETRLDIDCLVAEHHEVLYRYAYRLCGNSVDAEDLTQQAFLIAHQKLDQIRDPATAKGWLLAILRNIYIRGLRKRVPTPSVNLELDVESIPEDLPELDIDQEALQNAINELPEEFRVVVLFFYFEECSYREVAERLEIPLGTVMSRLSRAKGYLRAKLLEPGLGVAAARSAAGDGRE